MSKDEIIDMWKSAGDIDIVGMPYSKVEQFAKLVAAKTWAEGYQQGVEDERISEANIGIAGFGMKVNPARENPYSIRARGEA